ncbi:MAG: glycosyltransferase family 4 protein [Actinobacteria bacterium]|nr:glycosyltransferase family 4 protein [Actinomycetota bacterium]
MMEEISSQKLKIAIISPPWFPVPPPGYGGIEMIVSLLTEGLCRRQHSVTLFASGDSITQARLISAFGEAPHKRLKENIFLENLHALTAYERVREFDIVHDHNGYSSRLLGALTSRLFNKPVISTLHGPADKQSVSFFSSVASDLLFIAISKAQRNSYAGLDFLATIPNAIKIDDYPFSESSDGYLLFVGRMNEEKGAHIAVSIARRLGRKLIMVGKSSEEHEKDYFDDKIRPYLGGKIEYYGEVDQAVKLELYRKAECVLFPIQWPEPFGLVMIESMACGTPVIAIRNGSVPEVIEHGRTGYIVEDEEGMIEAVEKIGSIDRSACRRLVAQEYNEEEFISRHERAYRDALAISQGNAVLEVNAHGKI